MIDNQELESLMLILEEMEDEQLAVTLLKDLNDKTKSLNELLVNVDAQVQNAEWKELCDTAKSQVDKVISDIKSNAK